MSKKPYIYEHKEWLEIAQRKDWNDPTVNPHDLAEYSELQRPYAQPEDEDNYVTWEWSWPDIDFPDIPDLVQPDPAESDCSIDEDCTWAKIMGADSLGCGASYPYTQIHVILGCEAAMNWAALGEWTLETEHGDCELIPGLVIARVVCARDVQNQTLTLMYEGAFGCRAEKKIIVECEACCENFQISGAATVVQGAVWTGTISPACPGATGIVTSNSGCDYNAIVNGAGSQVTVSTGATDCGQMTVKVKDGAGTCEGTVFALKDVRITGDGAWKTKTTSSWLCMTGCNWYNWQYQCSPGPVCDYTPSQWDYYAPCTAEPYKYATGWDCDLDYRRACYGGPEPRDE